MVYEFLCLEQMITNEELVREDYKPSMCVILTYVVLNVDQSRFVDTSSRRYCLILMILQVLMFYVFLSLEETNHFMRCRHLEN